MLYHYAVNKIVNKYEQISMDQQNGLIINNNFNLMHQNYELLCNHGLTCVQKGNDGCWIKGWSICFLGDGYVFCEKRLFSK